MQEAWLTKIPYVGAVLYFLLAVSRTVYEATWDESPWCTEYVGVMGFYAFCFILALISPRKLETWRRHPWKLTSLWTFLLVATTEFTYESYGDCGALRKLPWAELTGYLVLIMSIGFIVAALVKQLNAHERKFELMSAGLSEALWTVNCATDEVSFSDSFSKAFGYGPEQIHHSMGGWYSIVHEEDAPGLRNPSTRPHIARSRRSGRTCTACVAATGASCGCSTGVGSTATPRARRVSPTAACWM